MGAAAEGVSEFSRKLFGFSPWVTRYLVKAVTMTDQQLLHEYVSEGRESSFEALVQRHVGLVYGTAMRCLGNPTQAEEVTQGVFITLATKAVRLGGVESLAGWLYRVARLQARQRYREEIRRQRREATAIELGTTMQDDHANPRALAGILDEALMDLREPERHALLLRFFEGKSLREVGDQLGLREDAAQKRVAKALDLLARAFRRRGLAAPTAALAIAALEQGASAAPAGLAMAAAQAALAQAGTASVTGFGLMLFKIMSLTKTQTVVVCLAVSLAPVIYEWQSGRGLERERLSLRAAVDHLAEQEIAARLRRDGAAAREKDLLATLNRVSPRPGNTGVMGAPATGWSDASPFVRVPRSVLGKISLPALGANGEVSPDMARVLGLDSAGLQRVNEAVARFRNDYAALEEARIRPSEDHSKSFGLATGGERKTFVRAAMPDEYAPLLAGFKSSLAQTMDESGQAYFLKNLPDEGAFSSSDAALETRVTLLRPFEQKPEGGPYFIGREVRTTDGQWVGGYIVPWQPGDKLPWAALAPAFAEWQRSAGAN